MTLTNTELFTELYNNLDTERRDDHQFYIDCTDVRGSDELAQKLCLDLSYTTGFKHLLFSGNIGCGKSAELRHIAKSMDVAAPHSGRKRFFPVLIDTAEYLDRSDVDITDILLTIISEMGTALQTLGDINFRPKLVERALSAFKDIPLPVAEGNIGGISIPFISSPVGQLKLSLQRTQKDPTARQKIREAIGKETLTFYEEINLAFAEARIALKKYLVKEGEGGYHDFVIILDNLEKVDRFESNEEGMKSHRALFIEKAMQFQTLQAHLVLTVPLSLLRAEGGKLRNWYSSDEPIILPNLKTEQRGIEHTPYLAGRERLKDVLQARIPGGKPWSEFFDAKALDFIIDNCGGHIRNFLRSARESASYARFTAPITEEAAKKSVARQVRIFSDVMRPDDWDITAELETSETQSFNKHDAASARLLEQAVVLEYVNGGQEDAFNEPIPWYGVNPIIRKMRPFALAIERVEQVAHEALEEELARSAHREKILNE